MTRKGGPRGADELLLADEADGDRWEALCLTKVKSF